MVIILLKSENLSFPPPHYSLTIVHWYVPLCQSENHSLIKLQRLATFVYLFHFCSWGTAAFINCQTKFLNFAIMHFAISCIDTVAEIQINAYDAGSFCSPWTSLTAQQPSWPSTRCLPRRRRRGSFLFIVGINSELTRVLLQGVLRKGTGGDCINLLSEE